MRYTVPLKNPKCCNIYCYNFLPFYQKDLGLANGKFIRISLLFTLHALPITSHLFKKVNRMTKVKEKCQSNDMKNPPVQGK